MNLEDLEKRNETSESLTEWLIEHRVEQTINDMKDFYDSGLRNSWLRNDNINIYVRKSKRFINNQMIDFLDLATIDIFPQGQGIFTKLLSRILEQFDDNIFIESILSERFLNFFIEKDFTIQDEVNHNVYKIRK